jgi:hypothetical protein
LIKLDNVFGVGLG